MSAARLSYNQTMFADEVKRALRDKCLAPEGGKLLLAVSGGADSMTLLHSLLGGPWKILVGHFNHQIRPEAGEDAEFLADQCAAWGVDLVVGSADVPAQAKAGKIGVEEAARMARYRFLLGLAEEESALGLVLGHNQDDNLETILMHFLRGSGLYGLRGLSYRRKLPAINPRIPILRPMLDWTKTEILAYCRTNKLPFVEDASNQSPRYFRNRLRHELMPLLDELNPAWRANVLRNAALAKNEAELLDVLTETTFADVVESSATEVKVNRSAFLSQPPALQTRFLLQTLKKIAPQRRDLSYGQVQRLRRAIVEGRRGMHLSDGLEMRLLADRFMLRGKAQNTVTNEWPQLPNIAEITFTPGEKVQLAGGWRLVTEIADANQIILTGQHAGPWHAWLAWEDGALSIRRPLPGERMRPIGMQGRQKISDIFINLKVPRSVRAAWPLVCTNGQPAWLAGLRIADSHKLVGNEKKVLHLYLEQDGNSA